MGRIDADDELPQRIVRKAEFELLALASYWRIIPFPPERLFLQTSADRQRSLPGGHMAFGRLNRQELGQISAALR